MNFLGNRAQLPGNVFSKRCSGSPEGEGGRKRRRRRQEEARGGGRRRRRKKRRLICDEKHASVRRRDSIVDALDCGCLMLRCIY